MAAALHGSRASGCRLGRATPLSPTPVVLKAAKLIVCHFVSVIVVSETLAGHAHRLESTCVDMDLRMCVSFPIKALAETCSVKTSTWLGAALSPLFNGKDCFFPTKVLRECAVRAWSLSDGVKSVHDIVRSIANYVLLFVNRKFYSRSSSGDFRTSRPYAGSQRKVSDSKDFIWQSWVVSFFHSFINFSPGTLVSSPLPLPP